MILTKIHKTEQSKIVSLCDKSLIGKKFEDKGLQLDISKHFYEGTEIEESKILDEIKEASSLNIVGNEAIKFALKHNLIIKDNIIYIKKIPHAISVL